MDVIGNKGDIEYGIYPVPAGIVVIDGIVVDVGVAVIGLRTARLGNDGIGADPLSQKTLPRKYTGVQTPRGGAKTAEPAQLRVVVPGYIPLSQKTLGDANTATRLGHDGIGTDPLLQKTLPRKHTGVQTPRGGAKTAKPA